MFSVTSEAAANAAFQAAPHWSTRSDQPPANDVFGGLVNQNTAADTATAPPPRRTDDTPPPRRSDDTPPPADNAGAANAASNQAASNDPNSNANAGPPSNNNANNASSSGPTGNGATQPSQAKSTGAPKADPSKSTDKPASGVTSAADLTIQAQQAALTATTPNPVAVAIPVTTAAANVPAATPSGNSTAPLAIAAAAIAASTQAVSAQAASSTQIKTDSNTAAADAAATRAATTAGTATAKTAIAVATSGAAPVIQQTTQANATPANAAALTSAVAATAPVTPKATTGKSSAAAAAPDGSTTTSGTADPSATTSPAGAQNGPLQQSSATAKPVAANPAADAATADAAASSTLAAAVSAHEHSPAAGSEHALTNSPDPSTQVTGTIQPQLNSPATSAAPGGAFTVTAQASGPVPLSGLAMEIAASAKSGKSRFEIRLDPADLGRIDVRIDIDRNGQVTSHLTVEKPETLSMLRQDAPQLQRALDDAGLKTGNGGLQFSLRDQSSSGQNSGNDSSPNAQRLVVSADDAIPAAVAGRTYGRSLGSSSGVDIRV